MGIGFLLADLPGDDVSNPILSRKVIKAITGGRPSLHKSYLKANELEYDETTNYRHIIAYNLVSKALSRTLKGMTLNEVAQWLENNDAWLDPNTRDYYRNPTRVGGAIPRNLLSIQAGLTAWLANATSCIENLYVGDAAINKNKGAKLNPTKSDVKDKWQRHLGEANKIKISCVDPQNGLPARCIIGGSYIDANDLSAVFEKMISSKGGYIKTEPGTKLVIKTDRSIEYVNAIIMNNNNNIFEVSRDYDFNRSGLMQLGSNTHEPATDGREINITHQQQEFLKAVIDPLELESKKVDAIEATDMFNIYLALVNSNLTFLAPGSDGGISKYRKVNIGVMALGWKGKYLPKQEKELNRLLNKNDQENFRQIKSEKRFDNFAALVKERLGLKAKGEWYGQIKKLLLKGVDESTISLDPVIVDKIKAVDKLTKFKEILESLPIDITEIKQKAFNELRERYKTKLEIQNEAIAKKIIQEIRFITPGNAEKIPVSTFSPVPQQFSKVKLSKGTKKSIDSSGISLNLSDKDAMNKKIVKVIVGERPPLNLSQSARNDIEAHSNQAKPKPKPKADAKTKTLAYRHIIAHNLLEKALTNTLKGLTPNEVAAWLDNNENWLDQSTVQKYKKTVNSDLNQGNIPRRLQGVQAAVDAWLKNATNYVNNLFLGDGKINQQKGSMISAKGAEIKKVWRKPLGNITDIQSIRCIDAQSGQSIGYYHVDSSKTSNYIDAKTGEFQNDGTRNLPIGRLAALSGAKFEVIYKDGRPPLMVGALFVDRKGQIFQVSRKFKVTAQLEQDAAMDSVTQKLYDQAVKEYLKAAIDPSDKALESIPYEKIDLDTKPHASMIEKALKSLSMNVPIRMPNQEIEYKNVNVVALALGRKARNIPTTGSIFNYIKQQLINADTPTPSQVVPRGNVPQSQFGGAPQGVVRTSNSSQRPDAFKSPSTPGYPTQGYPTQGYPTQGYPTPGYPTQGYPTPGYPTQGYPTPGYPTPGYPTPGYPTQGYPTPGYPTPGYPTQGYPTYSKASTNPGIQSQPRQDYPSMSLHISTSQPGGNEWSSYSSQAQTVYSSSIPSYSLHPLDSKGRMELKKDDSYLQPQQLHNQTRQPYPRSIPRDFPPTIPSEQHTDTPMEDDLYPQHQPRDSMSQPYPRPMPIGNHPPIPSHHMHSPGAGQHAYLHPQQEGHVPYGYHPHAKPHWKFQDLTSKENQDSAPAPKRDEYRRNDPARRDERGGGRGGKYTQDNNRDRSVYHREDRYRRDNNRDDRYRRYDDRDERDRERDRSDNSRSDYRGPGRDPRR